MTTERNKHQIRRPHWIIDYVSGDELSDDDNTANLILFADCDPIAYEDAEKDLKWQKAMDIEIESIKRNNTWELTDLPQGQNTFGLKWVYKTKLNEKGELDKYKALLAAKGYTQKFGIDYGDLFAPFARLHIVRLIIAMAAQNSWPIYQLDIKPTFFMVIYMYVYILIILLDM